MYHESDLAKVAQPAAKVKEKLLKRDGEVFDYIVYNVDDLERIYPQLAAKLIDYVMEAKIEYGRMKNSGRDTGFIFDRVLKLYSDCYGRLFQYIIDNMDPRDRERVTKK
ncbi:MAG: hypothetical protein ACI4MQ_00705 [Candidatus Coproplasma sp.]